MELVRLSVNTPEYTKYYDKAILLYESAFPPIERRGNDEQQRIMTNEFYHFDLIFDGELFVGIMLYWEFENILYLEHFATFPELRNQGYGLKSLRLLKLKQKVILLEVEKPENEITQRRYGFYLRNDFIRNPITHIQAKYKLGYDDCQLIILSYPRQISDREYLEFVNFMNREIGIQPNFSNDVTVRPMNQEDDANVVAKLIYLSDVYIYPYWFDTIQDGTAVISAMIDLPTIYNRKNIHVAVNSDNTIVGALVGCDFPIEEKVETIYKAFEIANVPIDKRTDEIFKDYYSWMNRDDHAYYIANVTIDPDYRHKGVGATLLYQVVKDKKRSQLECVVANSGAWRLYQRIGFSIKEEYPGVFGVPCYRMVRNGE